jgi:hypothetical protein
MLNLYSSCPPATSPSALRQVWFSLEYFSFFLFQMYAQWHRTVSVVHATGALKDSFFFFPFSFSFRCMPVVYATGGLQDSFFFFPFSFSFRCMHNGTGQCLWCTPLEALRTRSYNMTPSQRRWRCVCMCVYIYIHTCGLKDSVIQYAPFAKEVEVLILLVLLVVLHIMYIHICMCVCIYMYTNYYVNY